MTNAKPHRNDEQERVQLGERLRQAREYLGLKQKDVSDYIGIPRTALGDIEAGQRRVDAIELNKLAKLYKQPVSYFTGEDAAAAELPASIAHLARQAAELSDKDKDELRQFVAYLQNRSQSARD